MSPKILLTSFTIWEDHHQSNSADDLLELMTQECDRIIPSLSTQLHYLRQLPVDYDHAPARIIEAVNHLQPHSIICCGMAETRPRLSVESCGTHRHDRDDVYHTPLPLDQLIQDLTFTDISYDAGSFVCNHTYYSVLKHVHSQRLSSPCLFVHVPVLTTDNQAAILTDFTQIVQRISVWVEFSTAAPTTKTALSSPYTRQKS
ncbi:MAG: pyroglutamyl-peptidase I family protein [Thainema sp.]